MARALLLDVTMRHLARAVLGIAILVAAGSAAEAGRRTPPSASAALAAHLPRDRRLVMGVDMIRVRRSELFRSFAARLAATPAVARLERDCGIDLLRDIDLIAVVADDLSPTDNHAAIAVKGRIDRERVIRCIERLTGSPRSAAASYVSSPAPNVVVWSAPVASGLRGDVKRPADRRAVLAYVDRSGTGAAIWIGGLVPPAMRSRLARVSRQAGDALSDAEGLFASAVPRGDGLSLRIGVAVPARMATEAAAAVARRLDAQPIPGLKVTADGAAIVVRFAATRAQLESFARTLAD